MDLTGDEVLEVLEHFMKKVESPTIAIGKEEGGFLVAAAWKTEIDGDTVIVGADTTSESSKGFPTVAEALVDLFARLDNPPRTIFPPMEPR
jgi:hypothetical protein